MANRRRPIPKRIWFTEEEWHLVEAKMVEAEMTNFSAFGLEMLLHAEVRHYDFSNLKQLNASIGRIAGSINQIAKRCNENKSVHTNDVEQLRREFLELKADYPIYLLSAVAEERTAQMQRSHCEGMEARTDGTRNL